MNRIRNLFKKDKDKLIVFLTAGYPEINSTEKLVLTAVESGADMIEIGIPFSDPQADGPIIQKASEKALSNGITLDIIFQQVKSIRKKTNIPISLMGYYNPILKRGIDRFLADCVVNEIDGIILPDLPYDEGKEFCNKAKELGISPILLVAPNTSNKRIEEISNLSNDLIYAVSILGITGNDIGSKKELIKYLNRVKANSSCPFIVGFGIKSNDDVKWFNKYSNGAVVGSHILDQISADEDYVLKANEIINSLSKSS
jgi:tryptophan synthase alpha chain